MIEFTAPAKTVHISPIHCFSKCDNQFCILISETSFAGRRRPRPHRRRESAGVHGAPQEALRVIAGLRNLVEQERK